MYARAYQRPGKQSQPPSDGSMTDKKNSGGYDIGELATSSILGLVATVKEHITKPTAMAQGRVAHLIEWKGWGGGGGEAGSWGTWSGGWSSVGLEEDQQHYSQMTDAIKEARFAAGVAEQFALAEMQLGSMDQSPDQPCLERLQGPESHFLSQFLLHGGSVGVPQHLYVHTPMDSTATSSLCPPRSASSMSPASPACQQDSGVSQGDGGRPVTAGDTVRHADSSSLSEDEVFYD
ncbi:protein FAM131C [Aplochiton taeniatus]